MLIFGLSSVSFRQGRLELRANFWFYPLFFQAGKILKMVYPLFFQAGKVSITC